jgi:protease-4
MRAAEVAAAAIFLALCAIGGIYFANNFGNRIQPQPAIGVVRFDGPIDVQSSNRLITLLDRAREDGRIAGVVLELLSPGGYATSSESIYYTLLKLRAQKPVVVVVDGLAASGGYYMAAAGNRIIAPASAEIGNVGTRGGRPSDPALAPGELSTGPYKLEGGSRFDHIHQLELVSRAFITNVVTQRLASPVNPIKLSPAELGEARLYLGSEALALGLIDAEGARADGVQAAAELAGLTSYDTVGLPQYFNLPSPFEVQDPPQEMAARLLSQAPPGTILMLDSRIPLPPPGMPGTVDRLAPKQESDAVLDGVRRTQPWIESLIPATSPTTAAGRAPGNTATP